MLMANKRTNPRVELPGSTVGRAWREGRLERRVMEAKLKVISLKFDRDRPPDLAG
jgi:hypothetical protein